MTKRQQLSFVVNHDIMYMSNRGGWTSRVGVAPVELHLPTSLYTVVRPKSTVQSPHVFKPYIVPHSFIKVNSATNFSNLTLHYTTFITKRKESNFSLSFLTLFFNKNQLFFNPPPSFTILQLKYNPIHHTIFPITTHHPITHFQPLNHLI